MPATKISATGLALIKEFEGFVGHPYRDAVGVWTVGYGETKGVTANSKPITESQASRILRKRINEDFAPAVVAADKKKSLNQHQFDALVSFVYNCGTGSLSTKTGIGRAVRAGQFHKVPDEMKKWVMGGGKPLPGLVRRRDEEAALFVTAAKPYFGFRDDEVEWIREFDKLLKAHTGGPRRKVLRDHMALRRKYIWKQAQKHGWDKGNRRKRYNALAARTR